MTLNHSLRKVLPIVAPCMVLLAVLTWFVRHNGFFWDSILLASNYGQWYYNTRFSTLFVSQEIAGYPPLFGLYMAAGWSLFGKSLAVSHFLMLPFLLGIVWQVYLLTKYYLPDSLVAAGVWLILLDPTLLAQSAQVAPDIMLVFLYLVCLNNILKGKQLWLAIALLLMAILSPRSQILMAAVFFTQVLLLWQQQKKTTFSAIWQIAPTYAPGFFLLLMWQIMHYQHFGWVGFNKTSDWGEYAALVTPSGFFRNIGIIIWRLLDFGRVALWLAAVLLLWRSRKNLPSQIKEILVMLLVPLVVLGGILVWFTNPIGHRYWLVIYIVLGLLTACLLAQLKQPKVRSGVWGLLILSLLSGHFWIYPDTVAKGWDATLAHLPYYQLRQEMMAYLDQKQIPWSEVGSDFPNLAPPSATNLTSDTRTFPVKDFDTQRYILHSNIFNGFTDQELTALSQNWIMLHEVRKGIVYLRLYHKAK